MRLARKGRPSLGSQMIYADPAYGARLGQAFPRRSVRAPATQPISCKIAIFDIPSPAVGGRARNLGGRRQRKNRRASYPILDGHWVTGYKRSKMTAYERFERLSYAAAWAFAFVALLLLAFSLLNGPLNR